MMPLVKKVTRIGNSSSLIRPRVVLDQLDWNSEEELELVVEGHAPGDTLVTLKFSLKGPIVAVHPQLVFKTTMFSLMASAS